MSTPESEYPKHYPWCVVGQLNADVAELTEAVAAKDRRIAELEAALRDAGGVIIATADLVGGFPQQLAQARREALEAAIREFSADHDEDSFDRIWVIDKLRGIMAREVKP